MNAYFNELSAFPHVLSPIIETTMNGFLDTCCTLFKSNVKKIVCENGPGSILLSESLTMHDFCCRNMRDNRVRLLISNFKRPYLAVDSDEETQYIEKVFELNIIEPDGQQMTFTDPMGISSALLNGSLTVSFASSEFWKANKRLIIRVLKDGRSKEEYVFNVSEPTDLNDEIKDLIASKSERNWVATSIAPNDKTINLSSTHHGNNKLNKFAKERLRPLDYFIEVSTSLEFDSKSSHFVKAINPDTMQIDVVLFWNEPGYSMRIKTTARDEIELRQMAQDLESRFGGN